MLELEYVKAKSAPRLEGLHPVVWQAALRLIERSYAAGIPILITQGLRTIEEQNELYAQGRTKPGQIVTNARGGYSYHNFGVAVDFCLLLPDGRNVSWDMTRDGNGNGKADWMEVVEIAKSIGFDWGGDWKSFKDYPHFEMTFGLSLADYRTGKQPSQAACNAILARITEQEDKEMQEQIKALLRRVEALEKQLEPTDPPAWAKSTVEKLAKKTKNGRPILSDPKGDTSFYRTLVVLDRLGAFD